MIERLVEKRFHVSKHDDPWRRLRDKEDDEEDGGLTSRHGVAQTPKDSSNEKLVELIQRAEPMIEQLNNLYNMYFAGAEKRPPIERRSQLDQLMATLQLMSKPTPALQFRFSTLQSQYITHRDRWEKLLKQHEKSGRRHG